MGRVDVRCRQRVARDGGKRRPDGVAERPAARDTSGASRDQGSPCDAPCRPNTRQQARRSPRVSGHDSPLTITRARSGSGHRVSRRTADLHQRSWTDRGKPGVFASTASSGSRQAAPRVLRQDRSQLLRVTSGSSTIGNALFVPCNDGCIPFYQSGFSRISPINRVKPGLVSAGSLAVLALLDHSRTACRA